MIKATRLEIPANLNFLKPSVAFVMDYTNDLPISAENRNGIRNALTGVLEVILKQNQQRRKGGHIRILFQKHDRLVLSVENLGLPIFPDFTNLHGDTSPENTLNESVQQARQWVDSVKFSNLGRSGQSINLEVNLPKHAIEMDEPFELAEHSDSDLLIRDVRPDEAPELSRLFHSVYGYNYINEYVYFPTKLREMLWDGRLISKAAVLPTAEGDRIVGSVSLICWNNSPPVYEAALGVVDPQVKNMGLFGRIFDELMKKSETLPMQYCLFDFVTNHDFSQRFVSRYQSRELALFLGNQVSETQAKLEWLRMGSDPKESDRYSLLVAIAPRTAHPFGKEIVLPTHIGEPCEFILKQIGLKWAPASRFDPMPISGDYSLKLQEEQKSAVFDFHHPGRQALTRMLEEWRHLLRNGYLYVAVDVPVNYPGLGQVYDQLARYGFFISGFIPYQYSGSLAFRFQFLGPVKISFDEIKVYSETAKKILKLVQTSYERNAVL